MSLSWSDFERLPGSSEANFEALCRSLVFYHYARCGEFRATANQPGVEFHLKLDSTCAAGKAGEWLGWQARWYHFAAVTPLGAARRKKILASIRTTERVLPSITKWILWTRFPLTRKD